MIFEPIYDQISPQTYWNVEKIRNVRSIENQTSIDIIAKHAKSIKV